MNSLQREKIWDPVTRLWHWVLVLAVGTSWSFGKFMSFDNVVWHFYLGYFILGLLVFRIIWGLMGPQAVRFSNLPVSPTALFGYSKTLFHRTPSGSAGHNPLGSLWIIAILLFLIAQGITGLFIDADDFFEYGPLFDYVSEDTAKLLNGWHYYSSNIILGMVILHVVMVIFYQLWKKENLITPMINGWKWVKSNKAVSTPNGE